MKKIQIACDPTNWDESTITVCGLQRNGRQALPVTTTARDLPEPWLTCWQGLVKTLRGVAPGEWAATFITAAISPATEDFPAAVVLTIHRRWDDATTAAPLSLRLEQPEAVAFFEFLTGDDEDGRFLQEPLSGGVLLR